MLAQRYQKKMLKFISLTTIQVGNKIKDRQERVFGSASYKHYTRKAQTKRTKSFLFLTFYPVPGP